MEYENYIIYLFLFMLFGFFWIIAFMGAYQLFVIAATTCQWYFSGQGSDSVEEKTGTVSIKLSMKWGMWYHLGSLAWGAFLVAVVTMIKVIFEYFAAKAEAAGGTRNPVTKAMIWCARGCIWCLDKCVKFINKNAYIQVALHSKNFCKSAWAGFYLTIRHIGKFSASGLASTLIEVLGKGGIIALNVWITILCVQKWWPDV